MEKRKARYWENNVLDGLVLSIVEEAEGGRINIEKLREAMGHRTGLDLAALDTSIRRVCMSDGEDGFLRLKPQVESPQEA